ncbi:MAG: HEAT repeat domain-containing protein [Pirellulales bacterium]
MLALLLALSLVDAPQEQTRVEAAQQLGNERTPESVKSLVGSLKDVSPRVRMAACQSLSSLGAVDGAPSPLRPLVDLFRKDTDHRVREAALQAIVDTGWKSSATVDFLIEVARGKKTAMLRHSPNLSQRQFAIEQLGLMGATKASPVMLDLLKESAAKFDGASEIYETCLLSLERLEATNAIPALKELRTGKGIEASPVNRTQAMVRADTALRKLQAIVERRRENSKR